MNNAMISISSSKIEGISIIQCTTNIFESLESITHQNQIQWKNVCKVKIEFQTNRKRNFSVNSNRASDLASKRERERMAEKFVFNLICYQN